ncbi:MAG: 4Fe-4S dicluster domain-containing protein, partial [Gammaproteobacteria bacterium]
MTAAPLMCDATVATNMPEREVLEFDALVVGGGPAGLAAAIRLRQLDSNISVCVIEKGAEVGAHILAGAVLEPRALNELLPDWRDKNAPIKTAVSKDRFWYLSEKGKWQLPAPPQMHNKGNYIVSLGQVVRWLGEQAEGAGADIFPGFGGADVLFGDKGEVCGVITGDAGIGKKGERKASYQPGAELRAKYTIFAEGCRGSLTQKLLHHYGLNNDSAPQTYAIGIKELWEVPNNNPGEVLHTIGWPLPADTYGGSFLYHLAPGRIALGFVVGLDYQNPHLSPYMEFQRFKHHPHIARFLREGKRIAYGARALNEGGWQSIPKLAMPGAVLAGCGAGFLNVPKIKGAHTAMKSGMLAAESVYAAMCSNKQAAVLDDYDAAVRASWIGEELKAARNIRPGFGKNLWLGLANAALETYVLRGKSPWTFRHHKDHERTKKAGECKPINYPPPDGKLSFSRLDNLAYSGVNHEGDQPPHLQIKDDAVPVKVNLRDYAAPETRYCPAGVYEFAEEDGEQKLVINAQNCVHCKT